MHTALASLVSALALAGALRQETASDSTRRRERAEALYAQGAFSRAHEAFVEARGLAREPGEARWCDFRIADTRWRARVASETPDPTLLDAAERELRALVRDVDREDEEDRVWAEVCESLGDFYWTRRDLSDFGRAWPEYERALAWWARSTDLDLARERYLAIVWKTASPAGAGAWERGGWIPTPDPVIENALAIAVAPRDVARAHHLRAVTLESRGGDWRAIQRVEREYRAALEGGPREPWYDDALFGLAEWLNHRGRVLRGENGAWRQEPDHVAALALYRRLVEELAEGESRFRDDARGRAEEIVRAELEVTVGHAFLPGSPVAFDLAWRNVRRVDLSLFAVDLARDVAFGRDHASGAYVDALGAPRGEAVARWMHDTRDTGEHRRGSAQVVVPQELAPGAYLLVASGEGVTRRELALVGDTCLVLRASPTRALVWVTSATMGEPVAEAEVALWERYHDGSRWVWRRHAAVSGADGLAAFELGERSSHRELFAAALAGEREAFALTGVGGRSTARGWKIQATTDRSAYRPGDTVRFKLVARRFEAQRYTTPAGERLRYVVNDPRGSEVARGELELNDFGSAWGELALAPAWALGEYQVAFETAARDERIGGTEFFRLEEYVLPEFEVSVRAPQEGGHRRLVRAGDTVEVEIAARYYSGGPVANATVHVLVHQAPFWLSRPVPREFPWLHDERQAWDPRAWGADELVQQTTLTTDADGVARVAFDTPFDAGTDLEYTVEARATDASRREVVGEGRVRVARQSFAVFPRARHQVYRPGDTVEVDFELVDANQQPVEAEGVATVYRERWFGVWRGPEGREITDAERAALAHDDAGRCTLVRHGYVRDPILTRPLRSDASGRAELAFAADRAGCYQVAWSSRDVDGAPIEAATAVWVAADDTRDLGWRRGELEILVDRDTLRAGEEAVVMLSTSFGGGTVLVCVASEDFVSWQVVEMRGPARLLRIPLDERSVPNVFVSAELVRGGEVWTDVEELVVPPLEHFLEVEIEAASPAVEPGAEGEWLVRTLGHGGEPVRAEVAVAIADESVLAIQSEYAVDPRRYFFGEKRGFGLSAASTAQQRRFARLVERGDGRLVDEREDAARRDLAELDALGAGLALEQKLGYLGGDFRAPNGPGTRGRSEDRLRASMPAAEASAAGGEGGAGRAVSVRTDFSATALWKPDLVTGADGTARVKLRYPQSLTSWRATARAATRESAFGFGAGRVRADLPLTIRLETPRFLVEGDVATISGLVDNHTQRAVEVAVSLGRLAADDAGEREVAIGGEPRTVRVPALGQVRVEWRVHATEVGVWRLRASARSAERGDAVEKSLPVHEHGIEQLVAASGVVRAERGVLAIDLPGERKAGTTRVRILASPSLAATMLDALPYLIDYPYGCVEQTLSRFLPAVVVAKTLRDTRVDPALAFSGVFGGVEGEYASRTHPKGAKPVELLGEVTAAGLERIYDFQHADGGWGWWKEDASDLFMSAYVVWGMELARRAGVDVREDALDRGAQFLSRRLVEAETQPELRAWMLHAVAARTNGARREPDRLARRALDEIYAERARLNAYGRALLALAAHDMGERARARTLVDALADGATIDRAPGESALQRGAGSGQALAQATAHWGADRVGRRWSDGPVETTAAVLRALVAIEPEHELVAPAMTWLVKNRRGAQWSSTRDTALAVLALNEYLAASGELDLEGEYEVSVNGVRVASERIARGAALAARRSIDLDERTLRAGANEILVTRRSGSGPLYVAVEARYFNREERVRAAGNELFVRREYFALVPRKTLLEGVVHERVPLAEGARIASGTRVRTVLTLEAKNELEYLLFEDSKPAGIESVDLVSGGWLTARELRADAVAARMAGRTLPGAGEDGTGRTRPVYRELRDREVALFVGALPQGTWEIEYEMRAETPGEFRALPLVGQAMYAPEIRGNDLEIALAVD